MSEELPEQTQQAYDQLASEANTEGELATLEEMRVNDVAEREEAIKDIANRPLPSTDSNGVAMTPEEEEDEKKRREDGDNPEYGQGGSRA